MNMNTKRAVAVMAASVTLLCVGMSSATSASIQVDTAAYNNRHWMTVFTNEVPLTWNWPTNATSATLAIVGMNSSLTTDFAPATSNYLWEAFTGDTPAKEDVCDLTLTFYKESSTVVGSLTSRLAIVQAPFGLSPVDTGASDETWTSLTLMGNVVLPYDGRWTAATEAATVSQLVIAKEDGMTQTNNLADASGYLGWKLESSAWGNGTFNLALTFPGTVMDAWTATLVRLPTGIIILIM